MKRLSAILFAAMVLAACSASELPLAKQEPVSNVPSSLVKPPWEALVQAQPGAAADIDLETLDGPGAVPMSEAAPVQPNAIAAPADGAIRNVFVAPVAGQDGDATVALTAAMRRQLSEAGWPVLNSARGDALTVSGKVMVSAVKGGSRVVSLDWTVKLPSGKVLGVVSQKNDVPAAALAAGWGETAEAATAAAADGIFDLVGKAQGAQN